MKKTRVPGPSATASAGAGAAPAGRTSGAQSEKWGAGAPKVPHPRLPVHKKSMDLDFFCLGPFQCVAGPHAGPLSTEPPRVLVRRASIFDHDDEFSVHNPVLALF